jgi:hypothetical protein
MSMSLRGRLETRVFLILTVGLLWTLALTAVYRPGGEDAPSAYRSNLTVLALMGAFGLGWELVYHALQQLRWDRDWPSVFAALAVVNEGALLWVLTDAGPWPRVDHGSAGAFALLVGTTWFAMWLFVQGPMRVVFLRWRLQGGRILCAR